MPSQRENERGRAAFVFAAIALVLYSIQWLSSGGDPSTAKGGNLGLRTNDSRQHFVLAANATWQLDSPHGERFDASGLAFQKGKLFTLSDRGPELYEIRFQTNSGAATTNSAQLVPTPLFPRKFLAAAVSSGGARFDCEGITVDPDGNFYICEESRRDVFRSSPDGKKVERLQFDFSPVRRFFSRDPNASWEGIAIGQGHLYLANERESPRIVVLDFQTHKVIDSFFVDSDGFAFGGPHYSDLAFADGHLFVLDRNHRCILEVDPEKKQVLAEYSFGQMEVAEDVAYKTLYPTGTMEGLAIDAKYFWLVTDNNGLPRFKHPRDIRPTLFRCPRPRPARGESK